MGTIVVGIDGSNTAGRAVDEAAKLAKDLGDKVVVVFGYSPQMIGGEIQDHRAALEELGAELGSEAIDRVKTVGADGELRLVEAESVEALLSQADDLDARMIVVGSQGDSPLKGAILGSTPHKLVHLSKRPVLVVHGVDD